MQSLAYVFMFVGCFALSIVDTNSFESPKEGFDIEWAKILSFEIKNDPFVIIIEGEEEFLGWL